MDSVKRIDLYIQFIDSSHKIPLSVHDVAAQGVVVLSPTSHTNTSELVCVGTVAPAGADCEDPTTHVHTHDATCTLVLNKNRWIRRSAHR